MNGLGKISRNHVAADHVSWINVDDALAGQRIDNFLLRLCKGVPKSHIYRIFRSGEVRVNKGRVKASYRLKHGDIVRVPPIRVAQLDSSRIRAPATKFTVLYEDDCLIVLDKPAGIAVHGGSGVSFGIIEQMRAMRPDAAMLELVHRLDRETSGVLLLAKKRAALINLHQQIREGRLDKRYLVCAHGEWLADWGARHVVKEPLYKYRTTNGERRVRVQFDGQASHTVFNLRRHLGNYLLLEAELKTGRTHQIRVHLAHLGLPIVGDDKYGNFLLNKDCARPDARPSLRRMFLHAWRLRIQHPVSGIPITFSAPLPVACSNFLQQLLTNMFDLDDT
ncbi:RluA family pseudouridine synthase [Candidatus Vallotia cooleyia]|uniref:RluA family pseudouridine synthase n=1 Tax=Candidatus Vallotiella adelgis TaxID=1177211 RepID=UPI001D001E43|nr:RluA family pseudouridine synthase [Candidatus Vallotia cooleyia]UDG82050.1 Ribosomal large subunit pseudouridine synthase C [Candidatus Vallotia cooleyia]